ncbi:hypothetical protein LOK46_27205 [Methylobacterium sp. NMS14P]|uniref:hypothetical protein n=1 Tax=Methylobacterium sp. NMS14P TaxID=2894310 RepID=UPI0023590F8F|nr:hypothetical protein [Methylobacterium sp. NMS14P]WCS24772.1 hypothetical protein LOK46_27205 [Methylobacterium sp. NMS14P]
MHIAISGCGGDRNDGAVSSMAEGFVASSLRAQRSNPVGATLSNLALPWVTSLRS